MSSKCSKFFVFSAQHFHFYTRHSIKKTKGTFRSPAKTYKREIHQFQLLIILKKNRTIKTHQFANRFAVFTVFVSLFWQNDADIQ